MLGVFEGESAPRPVLDAIREGRLAGVAIYRTLNARDPAQVEALTARLEAAAAEGGRPRPLICVDQEGGQLVGIPGTTPFPGNLALGAAGDPALTERVGRAIGTELAAMGVTVDWAPVCDLIDEPANAAVGTRSFGDDPEVVGRHAAALVSGLRSAGIAASAKHFPGMGRTVLDPHLGLAALDADRADLGRHELAPFRAAVNAGVETVMVAHLRLPAIDPDQTALCSPRVLGGVLRGELGFDGVIVSDALDMGAVDQETLGSGAIEAIGAGVDLLLPGPAHAEPPEFIDRLRRGIAEAAASDRVFGQRLAAAAARVDRLRSGSGRAERPSIEVVGGAEHRALAAEVAGRSVTLIRDRDLLLPVRAVAATRVLVVVPQPTDLTPADTSSFVSIDLARALRHRWPTTTVDEIIVPIDPLDGDIVAARVRAQDTDLVVLGTINAFAITGQMRLAEAVASLGRPTVHVCLRLPHDALALPSLGTVVATYGIEQPAIEAVADVIAGIAAPQGRLPVTLRPG